MFRSLLLTCALIIPAATGNAGPLHTAAKAGDTQGVAALIAGGTDVDEIEYPGGTPLHVAANEGYLGVVELLISAGANVDALEFVKDETPLHIAAAAGRAAIARALVEAGADIEARGNWGYTPLVKAITNGHPKTALLLIELGADIHTETDAGVTPLHKAGEAGLWDLTEVLLSKGAGPSPPEDVKPLLAGADPVRGAQLYEREGCKSCHDLEAGGVGNTVGPPLQNVVGRGIASVEGFTYSQTLTRLGGKWGYENLNLLLADASGFFPGIRMIAMGNLIEITDPLDRADIIIYLRSQADQPFPLP